ALLVVKYDKAGNVVWQDQVTTPPGKSAEGTAIAVDNSGNVYVSGEADTGQHFAGDSPNSVITIHEVITIKYSPSGQRLWMATRVSDQFQTHSGSPIRVDSGGNSCIAVKFATASDSFTAQPSAAVIKYNANGNKLWENDVTDPNGKQNVFPGDLALDAQ